MNKTLQYYRDNQNDFVSGTINIDFSAIADQFLQHLPLQAYILDLGCGAGRDTRYFLDRGYQVDAADGSPELCRFAAEYTGIPVRCMLFQELDACNRYDGIWACASILHVSKRELPGIFQKIIRALKPGGILYASFKYGDYEGVRGQRFFSDFTEKSFSKFIASFPALEIVSEWMSGDARPERSEERWLNIILKKSVTH